MTGINQRVYYLAPSGSFLSKEVLRGMAVWACWRSCWHCSLSDVPRIGEARERGCPAGVGTRCQVVFLLKGVLYSHGVPSLSSLYSTMGIRQSSEQPLWGKEKGSSVSRQRTEREILHLQSEVYTYFDSRCPKVFIQHCTLNTSKLSRQAGRKHFKRKIFAVMHSKIFELSPRPSKWGTYETFINNLQLEFYIIKTFRNKAFSSHKASSFSKTALVCLNFRNRFVAWQQTKCFLLELRTVL